MTNPTRAEALAQARADLAVLATQVAALGIDAAYVGELHQHWDDRLAALGRIGSHVPVSSEVAAAIMFLATTVRSPDLDQHARVRWLDAFPDAIADLFPPSAVTYQIRTAKEPAVATPRRSKARLREELASAA
jgi:hypothetical protein